MNSSPLHFYQVGMRQLFQQVDFDFDFLDCLSALCLLGQANELQGNFKVLFSLECTVDALATSPEAIADLKRSYFGMFHR